MGGSGGRIDGFSGSHMAGTDGDRMASMGREGYGRRLGGGYYDYGSCPYYSSYDWPNTCAY
jgi:hypothetical protein